MVSRVLCLFLTMILLLSCDSRSEVFNTLDPGAPTIELDLSTNDITPGDTLEITLTGRDDKGLHDIWWFAEPDDLGELSPAHVYLCEGALEATHTWRVQINVDQNFRIGANARDLEYPVPGEAHQASEGAGTPWEYIRVHSP